MKKIIVAKHLRHLAILVRKEMETYGNNCDLNHIDISRVTSLEHLFSSTSFNGDISRWDTSNVVHMINTFALCKFNGDISKWNVSKVEDMSYMFSESEFNGDISNWDVSNVVAMDEMFSDSKFIGNIEKWTPYKLQSVYNMFLNSRGDRPYWLAYNDNESRKNAIINYKEKKDLEKKLLENLEIKEEKKVKIKI